MASDSRHGHWVVVGMIAACAIAAACSAESKVDSTATTQAADLAVPDDEALPRANSADIETAPNLKVAFIGDTAAGTNFKRVLQLVKNEHADLVMVQGDLTYGNSANDWFRAIDNSINQAQPGSTAPVTIPYFVSKGNHDVDWGTLGSGLKTRLGQWDVVPEHNDPTKINYALAYKGLGIVMVGDRETQNPSRADYLKERLVEDRHIWKICSWHKNMRASNVGPKGDEMGWAVYENCRRYGAIVAQGHSHTYSRSKTLIEDPTQLVHPACSDPFNLCVGPGQHFFFDSSIGGNDLRALNPITSKPHWASFFAADYGALFIEFNVDGDPRKARGYFKTIGNQIIDPPASSGRTSFDITSTN